MKWTRVGRYAYFDEITPEEEKQLLHKYSYTRKSARFLPNPMWGTVFLYDKVKKRLPIGLLQEEQFPNAQRSPILSDSLRDYQKGAVTAMLYNEGGIIQIPTGGGKTVVAIEYIKQMLKQKDNYIFLVLVPTLDLVRQWTERLQQEGITRFVCVKTYQSIKSKQFIQQFNCVIFDECHHVSAKTLFKIGMNLHENALCYGFSATPLDRDDDNMKVTAALGKIIYSIDIKTLVGLGYLSQVSLVCVNYPLDKRYYVSYKDEYTDLIVNNSVRNAVVQKLVENHPDKKILVLVNIIEHGEKLKELIPSSVFLNGTMKKEERLTDARVIIATSIFDEGVDLPDLDILILAGSGKSTIKSIQRVGRTLRVTESKKTALVYDFVDGGRWCSKHSKLRQNLFEGYYDITARFVDFF